MIAKIIQLGTFNLYSKMSNMITMKVPATKPFINAGNSIL